MPEFSLYTALVESAAAEGFALSGGVDIERAAPLMAGHIDRYDRWLEQGYAGAMDYLVRGRDRRVDPRIVFPGAKSVFCVGATYDARPLGPERGPRYARYLRSRDYHRELASRLESALERAARQGPAFRWKVCVDTSAVLERSWAALAGLGWIGKNTLLIHPKLGSYFFVAEALLDVELGRGPTPLPDLCGHCDKCQTGCPTGAFPKPRTLDSERCISYLTLEKRGEIDFPHEKLGAWVAGCDLCQEVCPFNTKASRTASADDEGTRYARDWIALIDETESEYAASVRDSALRRVKPAQFSRNLAIAFGNAFEAMTAGERAEAGPRAERAIVARLEREPEPLWERCLERVRQSPKRSP